MDDQRLHDVELFDLGVAHAGLSPVGQTIFPIHKLTTINSVARFLWPDMDDSPRIDRRVSAGIRPSPLIRSPRYLGPDDGLQMADTPPHLDAALGNEMRVNCRFRTRPPVTFIPSTVETRSRVNSTLNVTGTPGVD